MTHNRPFAPPEAYPDEPLSQLGMMLGASDEELAIGSTFAEAKCKMYIDEMQLRLYFDAASERWVPKKLMLPLVTFIVNQYLPSRDKLEMLLSEAYRQAILAMFRYRAAKALEWRKKMRTLGMPIAPRPEATDYPTEKNGQGHFGFPSFKIAER